jgi:hypothetical protein
MGFAMRDSYALLLLALELAAGLALVAWLYSGPFVVFDDTVYIDYAHAMLTGKFSIGSDFVVFSVGHIAVIAAFFALFGQSMFSLLLTSVIEYLLIVILTFLIARELHGNDLALVSALFASTSLIIVGYATRPLPDALLGVIIALSSFLLILATKRERSDFLFLLSGFAAGFAPLVRNDGFLFLFFYAIAFAILCRFGHVKKPRRSAAYFAAGIASSLSLYFIIFLAYAHNPLFGITSFQGQAADQLSTPMRYSLEALVSFLNPSVASSYSAHYSVLYQYPVGPIILFALFGSAVALFRRSRMSLLAVLGIGIFLYHLLGTYTLSEYAVLLTATRYLITILAPLAVLAAYFVVLVYEDVKARSRGYALLVSAVLVSYVVLSTAPLFVQFRMYNSDVANITAVDLDALSYFANSSGVGGTSVYLVSEVGGLQGEYLSFISGYKRIIQFLPAIPGKCDLSANSFIAVMPPDGKSVSIWNLNLTGSGCSVELVRNFTRGNETALIYVVVNGGTAH